MDNAVTAMHTTRDIQRNDGALGSYSSLELPNLGHQRSLHSLIEDDLESQENGSVEMARLLRQSEEAVESDAVTVEAPASEMLHEGTNLEPGHPTNSTSCDEGRHHSKMIEVKSDTKPDAHVGLWQSLSKRFGSSL